MTTRQEPPVDFEALVEYIRDSRGFDFTGYKRPSLRRRIDRRMQDKKIDSYEKYLAYLERNPGEFVHLFNTILINVTAFLRDEEAWTLLESEVVPRIRDTREPKEAIRVWSAGCATGEEAYSLAMVFAEVFGEEDFMRRVKIYATDVDDDALVQGRHATYTADQIEGVPPDRRERYFERSNGKFVFRKDLRRQVIFGRNDLIQDPPISKIDLLAARNTLMYFDAETQLQILENFHFALKDDGYLFLGKSEAVVARTNLFAPIDLKRRIFAKVPSAGRRRRLRGPDLADALPQLASETLVRQAGYEAVPVAQIVIDRDDRLILANLQARIFFGLTPRDIGKALKDLEVSFRPVELRSRIEQVLTDNHIISLREVEWSIGADVRYLDVQLAPLTASTGEMVGVGITFTEVTRYRRLQEALQESKREMETAFEELQSTVEELETTNEELQSTNEELETTNEELQSTNEELETTNEELQSTNEELETMNEELQERTNALHEANTFLDAVLASLEAGVAVLNTEFEIEAWNQGARELWGLDPEEAVGHHFLNLDIGLPVGDLRKPMRDALKETNHRPQHVVLPAVNRRGRQINVALSLMPLRSLTGATRGVIVMMQSLKDGATSSELA
jgi:two-component system, chemotaxis family, CheB/CheR fusion protein